MSFLKGENDFPAHCKTSNTAEFDMNYQKINKYQKKNESRNKEANENSNFNIGFWPNKKAYNRSIKIKNQRRKLCIPHHNPKYKTKMCFWIDITDYCPYGQRCTFAHSHSELRKHPKYKTVLCNKFRTVKGCPYGANCQFIHFITESKNPVTENVVRDATYKTAFFDINAVQRSINVISKVSKYPKHHKRQNKEENKCPDFYIGFWPNEMAFKRNKKIKNQRRSTTKNRDPKYKTRMCFWADISNYCPYGRRCTFAHSPSELRRHPKYKTVLCNKFRTLKGCPYGAECDFVHFICESKNRITEEMVREATYNNVPLDMNSLERSFSGMSL
ncbi:Zinc finger protein 36, C3H1 type-like 2-A [Trichinella nativa]|uniref:Zinc finger protein 36, C3H1 type-like 2-A n=1 Tax=Trichinella nativa TaxID=6335 RepID=A0A0V1L4J4_9BILA|nr:Zinc finger protein 36, C3H1 type-like 2-A [Trichinella nativa]